MSLRAKVVLVVLGIDLLIFGVLAFLVPYDLQRQQERERAARRELFDLVSAMEAAIPYSAEQGPDLGAILAWPHWSSFSDALLMEGKLARSSFSEEEGPRSQESLLLGQYFNPKGRLGRAVDFDSALARRSIAEAIDRTEMIETENSIAVPISVNTPRGKVIWGGGFFVLKPAQLPLLSLRTMLLLMAASLSLLGLATYWSFSRLVLGPVETLAEASRRVAEGDLDVHLSPPSTRDELGELIRRFDEMVGKLRNHQGELRREVDIATAKSARAERDLLTAQRLAALGTLAAGIAHEINNPLGGMLNAARSLERKDLPPEKRSEYLAIVLEGLERIRVTVSRVLQFAPRNQEVAFVSLSRAIAAAEALAAHRFRALGAQVETKLEGPDPKVLGNPGEIEQLFLNLFLNAADALEGRTGGKVEVSVRQGEGQTLLVVQDNGCGMKEELLPRALDPFFTTKEVGKGTGLGLSIAFSIVRGMGGSLEIWSREGEGFRVSIALPYLDGAPKNG